jgi:hypothetical protein
VLKRREPETKWLKEGKEVHKAMELRSAFKTPLPAPMAQYERYGVIVDQARERGMEVKVEQRVGLTRAMTPTGFFDGDVWCRIVMDLILVGEKVAMIGDWKTGKMKYDDPTQLQLFAGAGFALFPAVDTILTKYIWLVEGKETPETYRRDTQHTDIWQQLLPRVAKMERAIENEEFKPRSSWKCTGCIAVECEYRR